MSVEGDQTEEWDEQFYSENWEHAWQDMKLYSPFARHTRRWILRLMKEVPEVNTVCDWGCGEGSLLEQISGLWPKAQLYGTDFSEHSIELCQKRLSKVELAKHDLLSTEQPFTAIVDIGICSEVLEHIEDHVTALAHLAEQCRYVIVTVPGGPLDEMGKGMGHYRHYNKDTLSELAIAAGLEVVAIREWGFPFAFPLYDRLRNKAGQGFVTGRYGFFKRMLCHCLYYGFLLNDLFQGGNKNFLLARNPKLIS